MTPEAATDQVRRVFADELAEIGNEVLREKTVQAWARCIVLSGCEDLAGELCFVPDCHGEGVGVEHVKAVVRVSLAIADALSTLEGTNLDRDVIAAGALLHDVGKLLEDAPASRHPLAGPLVRHPFSGVHLGVEQELPAEVLHIIARHSREGENVVRTHECHVVASGDTIAADAVYRRDLGVSRAERALQVYVTKPH